MIKVKLFLTVGIPGSRLDFVSGWLGTLPGFVDSQWYLDPETGRSFTNANSLRPIDKVDYGTETLSRVLGLNEFELDSESSIKLSQGCHGRTLSTKFKPEDVSATTVICINTDGADRKKIFWEYLVKTYMSQQRWIQAYEDNQIYHVDKLLKDAKLEICDHHRVEFIENVIKTESYPRLTPKIPGLTCIDIDYDTLFTNNGSRELCKRLSLDVNDCYHQLWQNNLYMCNSPTAISKFGRTWSYDEIV
jgi:hypothetical protein